MALAWSHTLALMLLLAAGRVVGVSVEESPSARPLLNKRHMGAVACASLECVSEYSLLQTARDQEATDLGWPTCGGGNDLIPIECHRESTPNCGSGHNSRRRRVGSCPYNAHNLPRCNEISPGQMCKAYGECGTNTELNNCYTHQAGYDIYIMVAPPTPSPTSSPTKRPTSSPTEPPTSSPTSWKDFVPPPTETPTSSPTSWKDFIPPTSSPTLSKDVIAPTRQPTAHPTAYPTPHPTSSPTGRLTSSPTERPTSSPTGRPTSSPTGRPTASPTDRPTSSPTERPTSSPTERPTSSPTASPTPSPTTSPTPGPTASPTPSPTASPTPSPTWGALEGKIVEPSQPGAPLQPGAQLQPGDAGATGDPHLRNIHNERFDIMRPGKHVLLQIPKKADATPMLLRVGADVAQMGGACSDMYIQMLNVTGQWAGDGVQYRARATHASPRWKRFGEIELKVVWGRTLDGDKHYLNMFAKHLGKIGYSVGGLLGEDDHTEVATPIHGCDQSLSLMSGTARAPGIGPGSSAEASLL